MSFKTGGTPLSGQFHLKSTDPIDSRYVITSLEEYTALLSADDYGKPKYLYPGLVFTITANLTLSGDIIKEAGRYQVLADGISIERIHNVFIQVSKPEPSYGCYGDIAFVYEPASLGLAFTYNSQTKTCAVSGVGTCEDTNITIPSLSRGYTVTSIDESAFSDCAAASITIPDSITAIGKSAFKNCTNLAHITVPNSVTLIEQEAFASCSSLKQITIPENITTINNKVFQNCTSLTSIDIPESVTNIGEYSFQGCIELTEIRLPGALTTIGYAAFSSCEKLETIDITSSVLTIGGSAFAGCAIKNINIPTSVNSIGEATFMRCTQLEAINIPDSVKTIGKQAFDGCTSLSSVEIGSGLTKLPVKLFADCTSLESLVIPSNITQIDMGALIGCSALASLEIPFVGQTKKCATDTNQYPFGYIFGTSNKNTYPKTTQKYYGTTIGTFTEETYCIPESLHTVKVLDGEILAGAFSGCFNLISVEIPESISVIHESAFEGCSVLPGIINTTNIKEIQSNAFKNSSLTAAIVPDGIQKIGSNAFDLCEQITEVSIPNIIVDIESNAFANCYNLTSVSIGSGLKMLNSYVFNNCTSLSKLTLSEGLTDICAHALAGCTSLTTLNVPDSVIRLEERAFDESSLEETVFSNYSKLSIIGSYAFGSSFKKIGIPASIQYIGSRAFYYCSNLETFYIRSVYNLRFLGSSILSEDIIRKVCVYNPVPTGSVGINFNSNYLAYMIKCGENDNNYGIEENNLSETSQYRSDFNYDNCILIAILDKDGKAACSSIDLQYSKNGARFGSIRVIGGYPTFNIKTSSYRCDITLPDSVQLIGSSVCGSGLASYVSVSFNTGWSISDMWEIRDENGDLDVEYYLHAGHNEGEYSNNSTVINQFKVYPQSCSWFKTTNPEEEY